MRQNIISEDFRDKVIDTSFGGEITEVLGQFEGKILECLKCGKHRKLTKFMGYRHDGGLSDENGNKWWVFYHCGCGYDTSWRKWQNHLVEDVVRTKDLDESHINELYDFIVGSNLERAFINQCSKKSKKIFEKWFQIEDKK